MDYARGGVITGPDPTPIYTQTMQALGRDGYVIPASVARKLGIGSGLLQRLNRRSLMNPSIGRIVTYTSKMGDGIVSPAIVLRTRATTNLDVINRWGPGPEGTLSGKGRPAELVAELPDDTTVDLLVHGLGGDYREYAVPLDAAGAPGTWAWPARV